MTTTSKVGVARRWLARLVRIFRRVHPKFCWRCGGELVCKYVGFGMQCVCCQDCPHIPSQDYVEKHAKHMPPPLERIYE